MENGLNKITPSEIEKTLISLFEKEKKSNLIKASLFNFIIYTEAGERESYLTFLTKSIIKKFPCRIIFIKESDKEGDFLNTFVSSLKPEGEDKGFFCEFIQFEVSKSYKERVSFLVVPHVIVDLPIYLLFAKDPSSGDTPTTLRLDTLASRIIFDSETTKHMSLFASYIKTIHHENIDIGDLNWARFSPWRNLLTKVFSTKEKALSLATAKTITICFNPHSTEAFHHHRIQATYLQGWIASNMHWKFNRADSENNQIKVSYLSPLGVHTFILKECPEQKSLPPGRITSVLIESDTDKTSFTREESSPHIVKICHSTPLKCEIPILYPLTSSESDTSIIKEVYSFGTSPDFLAVIELISFWKTGIICS